MAVDQDFYTFKGVEEDQYGQIMARFSQSELFSFFSGYLMPEVDAYQLLSSCRSIPAEQKDIRVRRNEPQLLKGFKAIREEKQKKGVPFDVKDVDSNGHPLPRAERNTFQPTTPVSKTPPPVGSQYRRENARPQLADGSQASAAESPSLGKRQRDFVTLCDPQTGSFQDAEVRRIAYVDFEEHIQEPMSDRAFDVKFSGWFHPDKAAIRRLTKDQLHELYTAFMAMA